MVIRIVSTFTLLLTLLVDLVFTTTVSLDARP